MMEAVNTPEKSSTSKIIHGAISQKAVIFIRLENLKSQKYEY
jgi:hypothetical protein